MRLEGLLSEDQLLDVIKNINDEEEWIYDGTIKGWKEKFGTLSRHTVFVFVDNLNDPSAFKIYDTHSLGCGTSLTPPRWKIYKIELKGKL